MSLEKENKKLRMKDWSAHMLLIFFQYLFVDNLKKKYIKICVNPCHPRHLRAKHYFRRLKPDI